MKLRFTPRAVANIAAIADYIRERNPAASLRVHAAMHNEAVNRLSIGSPTRTDGCASSR